ncbi:MAG: hypothetical protein D6729_14680 [Deltaproteobacteria bacterium]|nr:MAG: hypothetical protein D6729_14680 [Deltaproteobacteria bacterium]
MFQPNPTLTHIGADRSQVVSIIESINHPHIGVPGFDPQVTQAYVVGVRVPTGLFQIYVYLYLTEDRRAVIYTYSGGAVDLEHYPEVEAEALNFVESMGFMVDNANFRNLPPEEQEALMRSLPCFHADLVAWSAEGEEALEDAVVLEPDEDDVLEPAEILELEELAPPLDAKSVERIGKLLAAF